MSAAHLETFERAFDSHCSGCRRTCECGREFYHDDDIYTWEEGEIEALRKNPNATCLQWSVGTVWFEGCEYVADCDCWHKRAEQIMGFIDSHAHAIADYLNNEKVRKQMEADNAPSFGLEKGGAK